MYFTLTVVRVSLISEFLTGEYINVSIHQGKKQAKKDPKINVIYAAHMTETCECN